MIGKRVQVNGLLNAAKSMGKSVRHLDLRAIPLPIATLSY